MNEQSFRYTSHLYREAPWTRLHETWSSSCEHNQICHFLAIGRQ